MYENGLPGRYPKSQHEAALRRAFGVFWSKARGVEAGAFARRLHQVRQARQCFENRNRNLKFEINFFPGIFTADKA